MYGRQRPARKWVNYRIPVENTLEVTMPNGTVVVTRIYTKTKADGSFDAEDHQNLEYWVNSFTDFASKLPKRYQPSIVFFAVLVEETIPRYMAFLARSFPLNFKSIFLDNCSTNFPKYPMPSPKLLNPLGIPNVVTQNSTTRGTRRNRTPVVYDDMNHFFRHSDRPFNSIYLRSNNYVFGLNRMADYSTITLLYDNLENREMLPPAYEDMTFPEQAAAHCQTLVLEFMEERSYTYRGVQLRPFDSHGAVVKVDPQVLKNTPKDVLRKMIFERVQNKEREIMEEIIGPESVPDPGEYVSYYGWDREAYMESQWEEGATGSLGPVAFI